MRLDEKLKKVEADGSKGIYFFRRGMLWVLYEESVYLYEGVGLRREGEEVKVPRVKSLGREVVQLFLSQKRVEELRRCCPMYELSEDLIYYELPEPVSLAGYEAWRAEHLLGAKVVMPSEVPAVPERSSSCPATIRVHRLSLADREEKVLHRLRTYNVSGHTPMESAEFLLELQRLLTE